MNQFRIEALVVAIAIICVTGLIAQCSHRVGQCQQEAIKQNIPVESVKALCQV